MTRHFNEQQMISYHLNELETIMKSQLEIHLHSCSECKLLFEEISMLDQAWSEPERLGSDVFTNRVVNLAIRNRENGEEIKQQRKVRSISSITHFVVSAAAALLFIHYGVFTELASVADTFTATVDETTNQFVQMTSTSVSWFHSINPTAFFK